MSQMEKRESIRRFIMKWRGKGKEHQDDQSFWIDLLQDVLGVDLATDRIRFQKTVIVDGNTKFIDVYIPETKVLIEQKSLGIPLEQYHDPMAKKTQNSLNVLCVRLVC